MTAPQTNKRATAKNLLAARITLVEELGDALDAHSKAVAAAAQARQHAEKTTEAARTAFEAAKASGPPPNSTAPTTRTRSSARAPSYPVLGADEHARNLRSHQPQVTPPLRPPVTMRRTPLRNARRVGTVPAEPPTHRCRRRHPADLPPSPTHPAGLLGSLLPTTRLGALLGGGVNDVLNRLGAAPLASRTKTSPA